MIEVRRMRATDSELENLICNLMASDDNLERPAGQAFTISDMTYASIKPVKVTVTGRFGDGRSLTLTITPDLLIASFVIFCAARGIPISRKSVKSVSKVRDGVAFDMVVRNIGITDTASPHQIRHAFLPAGHSDMATDMGLHLR